MPASTHYDVIIIGSGAGGGTLAHRLAPSGKRILILERGDYVPAGTGQLEHAGGQCRGASTRRRRPGETRTGRTCTPIPTTGSGATPSSMEPPCSGFVARTSASSRHHGGVSPAWPISYDDLEPYYTEAEHLYQVHGERGVDPTEPPASAPYLHPPVSHEPRIQQLSEDFARLGLTPFHVPLGVMLDESNPLRSRCIRCSTCDGHPCLVWAKSDAQVVCVDPALEHSNVTLMTDAYVSRLITNASGREVTGVQIERGGERSTLSADIVVVSCGAINSAALLLRSATIGIRAASPTGRMSSAGTTWATSIPC